MSARLELSLVEWRALAGVLYCQVPHEGGVWADEEAVVRVTGERVDRLCGRMGSHGWVKGQLDLLADKGLVVRHPTEGRVRVLTGGNRDNGGTLSFGMDLEKAVAAVELETPALVPGYPTRLARDRGGGWAAAAAGNVPERLVVETSERLNVSNVVRPAAAATTSVVAAEWRERVRLLVGDGDYFKFWGKGCYSFVFEEEVKALERAFNYVKAGLDSRELKIRTTVGRTLWSQFQIERDGMNMARAAREQK